MKAKDRKKARDILQQAAAEEETGRKLAEAADACRRPVGQVIAAG